MCTYVIPSGSDEVQYFTGIAARVSSLLRVLIDNTLLFLVNEEKDFIPRTLFIENKKFKEIADKIQSCIIPNFRSKIIVTPPDKKEAARINKTIKEFHIYKMNKDILDPEKLLKQGVTFSAD